MILRKFDIVSAGLAFFCLLFPACNEEDRTIDSVYHYVEPQYDLVQLKATADTLHFPLGEESYNDVKSFNAFSKGDTDYISFFDRKAKSINIWNVQSRLLVDRIPMSRFFGKHGLYYTTVYVKSFDSIFVNNKQSFYLFDSSGRKKDTIDFLNDPPLSWSIVANSIPPVVKGNLLYVGVQPYPEVTSLRAVKKWKMMYTFDLKNNKASLQYHFPKLYGEGLYGYHLLRYSYCYNDRGNFVFSFPADTAIYETNFADYHAAYLGKSQFQHGVISPVSKEDLMRDKAFENYLLRDSYSYIYFDPYTKRYFRLARGKISKDEYAKKKWDKRQTVIIFDENLKIIGESPLDNSISLTNLFFTKDGIYARTKIEDEYAIHFVRLTYLDSRSKQSNLARNESK